MPTYTFPTDIAPGDSGQTAWANAVSAALNYIGPAIGSDPDFAATITAAVGTKAPLASPTFTGTPSAPTAVPGTNTTQIATTAYVQAHAPISTVTQRGIIELATNAEVLSGASTTLAVTPAGLKPVVDLKANLASPALTGVPTAPTAAPGTNTTQLATTAFVLANGGGGGPGVVPDATETAKGIVELATTAEATTGTSTTLVVTPAGLKTVADTKANTIHTHTASQVTDLTATVNSLVPDASETVKGRVELATSAEAVTGTSTTLVVTPAGLKAVADTKSSTGHVHTVSQITDFATGVNSLFVDATETVKGKAQLATLAEVNTGTDAAKIVTPATLAGYVPNATELARGRIELANNAEIDALTDGVRAVTPLQLGRALSAFASGLFVEVPFSDTWPVVSPLPNKIYLRMQDTA